MLNNKSNKRYNAILSVIIIIILIIFLKCKNNNNNERQIVKNLIGKKFPLPEEVVIYNNGELDTVPIQYFDANIKVVSTIDGRCPACIENLSKKIKVKQNIEENISKEVDFLFFVYTKDFKMFKNEFYPLLESFSHPLIIQNSLAFLDKNSLPGFGVYQTVLTVNDEIRLVGAPSSSKKLEKLYIDEINKRLD